MKVVKLKDETRNRGQHKRHDMAPQIRNAFIASLKEAQYMSGKSLPTLMAEWLLEDPYKMLTAISKFNVREGRLDVTNRTAPPNESLPDTLEFLRTIVAEQAARANEDAGKK